MMNPQPVCVYYDGECPVCTREIATYRRMDGADTIGWIDVSTCSDAELEQALGQGVDRRQAIGRFHVRDGAGTVQDGVDAFIALWAVLPGTAWLARIASVPPMRAALGLGYRIFLRLRPLWRRGG